MSKYFALVFVCFLLCASALEGQALESKEKSTAQLSSAEQEALNLPDTPQVGETDIALLGAMYGDKGRVLQRLGMPEGALKAYNTGLSLSPNNNYLHFEKGRLLSKLGRYAEAYEELKGRTVSADGYTSLETQIDILIKLGRFDEALIKCSEIENDCMPNDRSMLLRRRGPMFSHLGPRTRVYLAMGKLDLAKKDAQDAFKFRDYSYHGGDLATSLLTATGAEGADAEDFNDQNVIDNMMLTLSNLLQKDSSYLKSDLEKLFGHPFNVTVAKGKIVEYYFDKDAPFLIVSHTYGSQSKDSINVILNAAKAKITKLTFDRWFPEVRYTPTERRGCVVACGFPLVQRNGWKLIPVFIDSGPNGVPADSSVLMAVGLTRESVLSYPRIW